MLSWGPEVVTVCMLRRGRVPKREVLLIGTDWCAGLAIRNGLVYGGVVGRPCCRSGCGHFVSNLRLYVLWVDRLSRSGGY